MILVIEGYTDAIGTDEYNLELSIARAKNVSDYLISKGLDAKKITYIGNGKKKTIADNQTEEGRTKKDGFILCWLKNYHLRTKI